MRLHGLQGNHRTKAAPRLGDLPGSTPNVAAALPPAVPPPTVPRLLVWSAADQGGIARTRDAWRDHPGLVSRAHWREGRDYLGDVAYTLAARRSHFPWRAMAVVTSTESLAGVADMMSGPTRAAVSPQLGLVFTGVSRSGMEGHPTTNLESD